MLASFTDSQTGQNPTKTSQDLHEQRCLQGRKTTHDLFPLHSLQSKFLLFPLFDEKSHADSASMALSLTWVRVLLSSETFASFSLAFLCHFWFSISVSLKHCSSSIVFFVAIANSSSFRHIMLAIFDWYLWSRISWCCLDSFCKIDFNLSFCSVNPNTLLDQTNRIRYILKIEATQKIKLKT